MSALFEMPTSAEAGRGFVVLLVLLAVMGLAEIWRARAHPPVEHTRKLVHSMSGLIATAFPWLFTSVWTVLILGLTLAAFLRVTRRMGLLTSVHGVERRSSGDLYFLAAVLILFGLGHERPVFYLVSLLVLILSDSLAALIGTTYGRSSFRVESSHRSLEGSAMFFLATFLCVHLPLLLLTSIDRLACVLTALQLALLVTSFEAVSLRGFDNLIVPVVTFCLLMRMADHPATEVALLIAGEVAIFVALGLAASWSRLLSFSGVVAAHLFFYGAWSLRGAEWAVTPALALAGFLGIIRLLDAPARAPADQIQVLGVLTVTSAALGLFLLDSAYQQDFLLPPLPSRTNALFVIYAGALAAQLALSIHVTGPAARRLPVLCRWTSCLPLAFLIVVAPVLPVGGWHAEAYWMAALTCVGGVAGYLLLRRLKGPAASHLDELRLQAGGIALAVLGSVLLFGREAPR